MEDISYDLYKLFYIVANSKTISEAANTMYVSQPAVTQGIKKLEEVIGGKLFYRSNKGISLTEEGQRLYNYLEKSIEILNHTHRTFDKYINLEEGTIKIRSGNMKERQEVYDNILRFMKDYPNIDVCIESGRSRTSMEDLNNGRCDMVLLNLPYKNFYSDRITITKVLEMNLELYCTDEYYDEFIKKEKVKLKDLSGLNFIFAPRTSNMGRQIFEFFEKKNITLKEKFISPTVEERIFMAENSLGILIATKGSVKGKKLRKIEITEKLPVMELGMAVLNDNIIGFATKELTRYIKKEK